MSRVYVIADLHLGHKKLAEVRGFASTEAHDNAIVEAWNRTVTKRDVVYVLGDVFRVERVAELHGTKKLAMGNHDQRPVAIYAALFSQVRACFEFDGCLLTHIPVHPCQFGRFELNVHGHMHANFVKHRYWRDTPDFIETVTQADDRYVPVSVEHCQRMEPMPLRELIQARRDKNPTAPASCNRETP